MHSDSLTKGYEKTERTISFTEEEGNFTPPISCNLTSDIPTTAARKELYPGPCYIRLTPLVAGLFVLLCLAVSLSFTSCEKEAMEELSPSIRGTVLIEF